MQPNINQGKSLTLRVCFRNAIKDRNEIVEKGSRNIGTADRIANLRALIERFLRNLNSFVLGLLQPGRDIALPLLIDRDT